MRGAAGGHVNIPTPPGSAASFAHCRHTAVGAAGSSRGRFAPLAADEREEALELEAMLEESSECLREV